MKKLPDGIVKKGSRLYYPVKLCGLDLNLPLFEVAPKTYIALFNILGQTLVVEKAAKALAKKLPKDTQVLVTPEVKSICLAYELSKVLKIPYVVVRKIFKPYMLGSIGAEVVTITTGKPQTIWLDGKDRQLIKGKKVVLVDDVISTGGTLEGLNNLMKKAEGKVIGCSAVFTEGDKDKWPDIISLGHLPVFNF